MKKYLMSGVAALAFAAAFTSCSKSTDLYDGPKTEEPKPTNPTTNPEVVEAEIQAAYEAAFINTFGKPDPDQDWGFGDDEAGTRAFTRAITINGDTYNAFTEVTAEEKAAAFPTSVPEDAEELIKNGDYSYYFNKGKDYNYKISSSGEYTIGGSWMNTSWNGSATVVTPYNVYVYVDGDVTLKRNGDAHFNLYILKGNVTLDSSFGEMGATISVALGATLNDNRDHIACNYGVKLFNRGTVNVGAYKIGNDAKIYNEGKFKATGALEYNSGAGNTSYFYNLGDDVELTAPSMTLNSTCNFISDGKVNISGETKVTKDGIVWVNNGQYTTKKMTFSAKNTSFYNYCNLIVTDLLHMYDGEFNLMANSYTEAATAEFDNFIVNMEGNSGFNVKGDNKWEAQGDGTYQGFKASGSKAYVRLGGTTTVAGHKNSLELSGNITYAINNINDLGANDSGVQPTYVFNDGTIEKPFDKVSVTPNTNGCGATWNIDGDQITTLRIICEDLSANQGTDFDFNDVVFDVNFGDNATLTVYAAGGTLPLWVGTNGSTYNGTGNVEVHELYGLTDVNEDGLLPMINTGAPAIGRYGFDDQGTRTVNLNVSIKTRKEAGEKIHIWVEKNGVASELTAKKGQAAAKIGILPEFGYLSERVDIDKKYNGKFSLFVQGKLSWDSWWK